MCLFKLRSLARPFLSKRGCFPITDEFLINDQDYLLTSNQALHLVLLPLLWIGQMNIASSEFNFIILFESHGFNSFRSKFQMRSFENYLSELGVQKLPHANRRAFLNFFNNDSALYSV
jgi:hypothetical protein